MQLQVKHAFLRASGRVTPDEEELTYGPAGMEYLERLQVGNLEGLDCVIYFSLGKIYGPRYKRVFQRP